MSNTKFTKGPWIISKHNQIIGSGGEPIKLAVGVTVAHYRDDEYEANAHLMSCAPEMYEMIHSLSTELLHMIRKENGRLLQNTSTTDLDDPDYLSEESVYLAQKLLAKARGE